MYKSSASDELEIWRGHSSKGNEGKVTNTSFAGVKTPSGSSWRWLAAPEASAATPSSHNHHKTNKFRTTKCTKFKRNRLELPTKMSRQFRCSTGTGRTAACNEIIIHRSTHWEELANLESQGILISPKGISWHGHFDDIFPSHQSHDLRRHN